MNREKMTLEVSASKDKSHVSYTPKAFRKLKQVTHRRNRRRYNRELKNIVDVEECYIQPIRLTGYDVS